MKLVLQLAQGYLKTGMRGKIVPLCESYLAQPDLSSPDRMQIAELFNSLSETERALTILQTIIT